jgi:lipid-A-disaccharide synthase-like uncharacterized protein
MSFMDVQHGFTLFGMTRQVTGWEALGMAGALCFAGRWFVQAWHRKRTRSAQMPTLFWLMSAIGAVLTSLYFIFGRYDRVGIVQNVLPLTVALYNLALDLAHRRAPLPP